MLRIGLVGATGKMASFVIDKIIASHELELTYALVRENNPHIGEDVGDYFLSKPIGVKFTDDHNCWEQVDALIDFSSSEISMEIAKECAKHHKIHIIGTTGISASQQQLLAEYAKSCVIIFSFNMSFAVNVLVHLVKQAAEKLDEGFDIEILDTHHRYKKDAPSGTALMLANAAAKGREVSLEQKAIFGRHGIIGKRKRGDIGFGVLRGGDDIFEHNVIFFGDNERIELSHKATSRTIYAKGAIKAVKWAAKKKYGLYSMQDVLAEK